MNTVKKSKFLDEFKEFILRGSVLDLAVAVVIGGAFQKIVTSFVTDIISPFLGMITGNANIASWSVTINNAKITYGSFVQSIIDFILVAFFIFLLIKGINTLRRKQLAEVAAKKAAETVEVNQISPEEKLLTEIRDILKNQSR
ncbi:MAG: large conductance mechanosensitive channel protein MscL [Desulfuromonadales bacterium]|nr:large conductance mechanosensitive channel protein MscL [Desulfuromonadales bacterium]